MSRKPISLWDAVARTDRALAHKRVAKLRQAFPDASREKLHRLLVRNKCLQAGAIGALTAITGAIPGIGRVAAFALGPLADTALVSALQAELVIETFALYEVDMPEHGEKIAIIAIAATNLGADEIAREASRWITQRAGRWIGARWLRRAWPIANIGTSAASNIAVTYAIGNRTQALCKIRDATVSDWPDLFRRVALIDQDTMMNWAGKAARTAIEQATESARTWSQRIGAFMPDLDFMLAAEAPGSPALPAPARPRPARKAAAKYAPTESRSATRAKAGPTMSAATPASRSKAKSSPKTKASPKTKVSPKPKSKAKPRG